MVLRRIGVLSCAKVLGTLYGLLGLVIGGVMALVAAAGMAAGLRQQGPMPFFFGIGAFAALPIFYGLAGFLGGLIVASLYNLVASLVGGLESEMESTTPGDYQDEM